MLTTPRGAGMLFTSLHWLVFLLAAFVLFHAIPTAHRRWVMLLTSVYFYASWDARYLALIAGQLVTDWYSASAIHRAETVRAKKAFVALSVTVNLSVLAFFKYYYFIAGNTRALGLELPSLEIILPLAISFYTFESMSYVIDVYRGELEPVRSPIHLALFVIWFPHLIAGPIIRPAQMVPQLRASVDVTRDRFFSGLILMLIGYAKKVLLADWLAKLVEPAFAHPELHSGASMLIAVYAYAFQIYLDFSAYTDIARGASRWFGIELPENFNDPYLASSITDFWRRWHMTLSHWLRDYLYVPLGGNRLGPVRTYVNLMLTMLLGGLWHGASWNFVVWGGLHGLYLAVERALGVKPGQEPGGGALWLRRLFCFHLVCFAWIFFRAPDFTVAWEILGRLALGGYWLAQEQAASSLAALGLIAVYWLAFPARRLLEALRFDTLPRRALVLSGAVAAILFMVVLGASTSEFIYFQF